MMYNQGIIILVPFPFTDLSTSKKRPVLVLSKDKENEKSDDLITCAITSKNRNLKNSIEITSNDLIEGTLPKVSYILVSKLFTIEKSLLIKKFGKLNDDCMEKVRLLFRGLV